MSLRIGHLGVLSAHPSYKRYLYGSYNFILLLDLFGNLNIENRSHKDQKKPTYLLVLC